MKLSFCKGGDNMLERPDLEDARKENEPLGQCEWCCGEIDSWEDYYDIDGVLVHEDCVLSYLRQYKKYA